MPYTFVKSRKGRDKLAHDEYIYRFDHENADGTMSWRCDLKPCNGRVKTHGEGVASITQHTCAINCTRVEVAVAVTQARAMAVQTYETARRIIATATETLSEEAKARFPRYNTAQRQLARDRQKVRSPYPIPATVAEIAIPSTLQMTKAGAMFLLHDSGADDPDRFFIFGTERNMTTLQENQLWCIDGTFKVCPELFYQLWTIHALVHNAILPLVYVFMTRKTEDLYNRVLDAVCDGRNLAPNFVVSDFEVAAMNSFRAHFPQTTLHGCFFHLVQSLWRKVQSLGFEDHYKRDPDFCTCVKMIAALAFVRPNDVVDTFDMLMEEYNHDRELAALLDFFEHYYIRGRNHRRGARFPIELWNCHAITQASLPRTNNNVEGWHHAFQGLVGCQHLSIYRLIESLRMEQSLTETRCAALEAGQEVQLYVNVEYRRANRCLQNLINDYDNRERLTFLHGCTFNFDF